MKINGTNYLLLERRGCEFFKSDEDIKSVSDIGNHRIDTVGYDVTGKDGIDYFLEFTHGYGQVAKGKLCIDTSYKNNLGCWRNIKLEKRLHQKNWLFTESDILKAVNYISAEKFDKIKYVHCFDFVQDKGENFTPADAIRTYAKNHSLEIETSKYGETLLKIYTGKYKYFCYDVKNYGSNQETVKVYLERE